MCVDVPKFLFSRSSLRFPHAISAIILFTSPCCSSTVRFVFPMRSVLLYCSPAHVTAVLPAQEGFLRPLPSVSERNYARRCERLIVPMPVRRLTCTRTGCPRTESSLPTLGPPNSRSSSPTVSCGPSTCICQIDGILGV